MGNLPSQKKIRKILENSITNLNINDQKDIKIEYKFKYHKKINYFFLLRKLFNFSIYQFHFGLKKLNIFFYK